MPPHLRDTGNGLIGAGWAAGAVIAPLIIGPVSVKYGWQAGFLATASLCLGWLPLWLALAFRPEVPLGPEKVNLKAGSDEAPRSIEAGSYALWATLLAILFTVPPTVFMNTFLSLFLSKTHGLTQPQINAVMWKPFLATDGGQLLGGFAVFLLLRAGWRYLSARTLIITIGFAGSAVMFKVNQAADAQEAIYWLCVSRFFFQGAYTVLGAYALESVSETQTAMLAGLMNATFSVCNVVFNPLIGRIADREGYGPVITIVSVAPLVGLLLWLFFSQLHVRCAAEAAQVEALLARPTPKPGSEATSSEPARHRER
jgi:ACS family hexuronate transporter-like MFS transporter